MIPTGANEQKSSGGRGGVILAGLIGLLLGATATAVAAWQMMPGMMITDHPSRYGLDETVAKIKTAAEANGWTVPAVRNMNKSLAREGVDFPRQVRLVELCKAPYAESILDSDRQLATLMPCAIAVYEADDGSVRVSGMNTALMGRLFGGNISDVMAGKVGPEEQEILSEVIR